MTQASPPDLSKLRIDRSAAPVVSRRRRRWLWWGGILLLLAIAGGWFALQPRAVTVLTTSVVTTYPSQQFVLLNATGYVVAQRKAAISSKATGRLEWLGVAEGSRVKAGDIIARIDARDAVAQLKRSQDLLAKGFVSAAAVDTAKARAEKATAGVANARATISVTEASSRNAQVSVDYTVIRAPFDGVILSKSANVGDLVTPFSNAADSKGAVVSMVDMSTLEVEADVAESSLSKVSVGQPAEILLDALPDSRFRGRISRIVPTVDRAKATVMTKVKFDAIDPRILPEMSAKVSFLSQDVTTEQQKPMVAVAADAIVQRDGRAVVFVIRDGVATAVPVTTGKKVGDLTGIEGAVKSGEKVVQKPAENLSSGALVKVAK